MELGGLNLVWRVALQLHDGGKETHHVVNFNYTFYSSPLAVFASGFVSVCVCVCLSQDCRLDWSLQSLDFSRKIGLSSFLRLSSSGVCVCVSLGV